MAKYDFVCPDCGRLNTFERLMAEGPPKNPACPYCYVRLRRVYLPVPIKFVGPGFSCSGRFDRPDERLKKEIEHSQDFDATTGKSWEQGDQELEKAHAEGILDKHTPGKHPYGVVE